MTESSRVDLVVRVRSQWGANSGHVALALESIPGFISRLQTLYQKTTGMAAKSPGRVGTGPKATIGKGGKAKARDANKKTAKKAAPRPKASLEDLDAELTNYTAARTAEPANETMATAE